MAHPTLKCLMLLILIFKYLCRREDTLFLKIVDGPNMSLACLLTCHGVESPSHSFRSCSVSSSDNEGRCAAIANCIARKSSFPPPRGHSSIASSSKVTPQPANPSNDGMTGPPRLVRSRAVRRDIVRDWNFDEVEVDH